VRFVVVLLVALVLVPFLPLYIERTMVRSMRMGHAGDVIEWGWRLRTLMSYWSDYRYFRPEQQPGLWLVVNIMLALIYATALALVVEWILARRRLKASACYLLAAILLINPVGYSARVQESFTTEQFTQDFDYLWTQLRDNYAYFDKKQTDWNRVREIYRPKISGVRDKREFVTFLERVLEELYDPHTHLKINTMRSTRLMPTGLDVWAEWKSGKAVVTQLRQGFSAEQAGLKPGMEITSINGVPVERAINERLGVSLKKVNDAERSWALRALLAGTRDTKRVVEARDGKGVRALFQLDLAAHQTVDNFRVERKVEWRLLPDGLGYIKVNDLGSDDTVKEFDAALEQLKTSRGLILDLRATQSGGNTSVAEPIMGRFIERRMPYQKGAPMRGEPWTREVSPVGGWTYRAPLVVLVNRWTASMGEGMAIGLDAMRRGVVVGTQMAGLNGAVFDLELPNTKIRLNYAAEKLFHMNGSPREDFVPPVLVNPAKEKTADPILEAGIRTLKRLIKRLPDLKF
jgi:carboxyl-terminal processing protease